MPRLIDLADHKNLWGATTTAGLEPQRSDLYLVDLTEVVKGLNAQKLFHAFGLPDVPKFFPQFVQSITLPELKLKPEPYRRDSVPFNMPSWDDPLDPVKMTFLLDTYENPNQSMVLAVLQAWQAIVRAGRGSRSANYNLGPGIDWVALNSNFRYDYTFPIRVVQLRGSFAVKGTLSDEQVNQMNVQMANQSAFAAEFQDSLQSTFAGAASGDFEAATGIYGQSGVYTPQQVETRPLDRQPWLEVTNNWILKDCWLGGWKMSDHSYGESKLSTAEATIYAEDLYQGLA